MAKYAGLSIDVGLLHCPVVHRKHPHGKRAVRRTRPSSRRRLAPPLRVSADNAPLDNAPSLRLAANRSIEHKPGCVYLVGAGPGDPGLLTLTAYRLLQTADVVLYDRLVSNEILEMAHGNARMIYVGKRQDSFHTTPQQDIHQLMSVFAEAGSTVVRLKGGDPYVFGRGGEEMEYLLEKGISVKCVPGVTAASGISAELGIPLTYRELSRNVRFTSGHINKGGEEELSEAMGDTSAPQTTLVVYMGLQTLSFTIDNMLMAGKDPKTPAVAVERGTTDTQRVVFSEIDSLVAAVEKAQLKSPTLFIVGEVVVFSQGWKRYKASGMSVQIGRMDCYLPRAKDLQSLPGSVYPAQASLNRLNKSN